MRSINIIMPVVITAIVALQACSSKDFNHCDPAKVAVIAADSQVIAGSVLTLAVSGIDNVHMYNWRGPNKFYSHDATPEIENVSGAAAGRYTVDVITNDGCIYSATTDSIKVTALTPPCTAINNYAEFNNTFDISLSSITGKVDGGSYFIKDYNGNLQMEFFGTSRPTAGIYSTRNTSDTWSAGNVRVRLLNQGYYWNAESYNKVYVNSNNGKLVINMCNVPGTWFGYKSIVTMQVTVP
jgi:hypothetical protein